MENSDEDIASNSAKQQLGGSGTGFQINDAKNIERIGNDYYNTELRELQLNTAP